LYFCFAISCSVSACTVVPVSANDLGISPGFTMFQINNCALAQRNGAMIS